MADLQLNLLVAGLLALAAVGLFGLLTVRNIIQVIICLQILAKATLLAFLLAGKINGLTNLGQSLAIGVIVVDTIVAVIGLALAIQLKRRTGSLDLKNMSSLRG